jgi:hypothetical protein
VFASDLPLERREELLGRIARKVVDLRLTPVAIILLESSKPLSFVGSQLMVFFQPIITAVFPLRSYDEVAALFEERENVEALIRQIERLEDERRDRKVKDNKNSGH